MEINAKHINELAKEMGFIRDNLEKMARLLQMLDVLFASPWKDKLVLKGGTAINLFYAGLPRLSVDIDLDYCGAGKEETVKDKAAIVDFVSGASLPLGYRLSDAGKAPLSHQNLETSSQKAIWHGNFFRFFRRFIKDAVLILH